MLQTEGLVYGNESLLPRRQRDWGNARPDLTVMVDWTLITNYLSINPSSWHIYRFELLFSSFLFLEGFSSEIKCRLLEKCGNKIESESDKCPRFPSLLSRPPPLIPPHPHLLPPSSLPLQPIRFSTRLM